MAHFFTSDLHLDHPGILKYQPERGRLFGSDLEAMNTVIIDGINSAVGRNDELWVIGDFCWKANRYGHFRQRINCRKLHIVMGNHDSPSLRRHVSSLADMVCRNFDGRRIVLCHYPIASWSGRHHGSIHLHGHCHGTITEKLDSLWPDRYMQDVGVDCAYREFGTWTPYTLEYFLTKFPKKDVVNV
jgi:calcineurin-like phosphoesterase family protein